MAFYLVASLYVLVTSEYVSSVRVCGVLGVVFCVAARWSLVEYSSFGRSDRLVVVYPNA